MAGGTSKIEETSSGEDDHRVSIWELVAVDLGFNFGLLDALPCGEASHVNFVIEMSDVSNDGVVLHL